MSKEIGQMHTDKEIDGRTYFKMVLEKAVADGVMITNSSDELVRSPDAEPLGYLPGQEPTARLTPEQYEQTEQFLKMPRIIFEAEENLTL